MWIFYGEGGAASHWKDLRSRIGMAYACVSGVIEVKEQIALATLGMNKWILLAWRAQLMSELKRGAAETLVNACGNVLRP